MWWRRFPLPAPSTLSFLGLEHQAHVVLLPFPENDEPAFRRALELGFVYLKIDRLNRLVIQVVTLSLDSPPGIGFRAGKAACHQQINHRQAATQLGSGNPAGRHIRQSVGREPSGRPVSSEKRLAGADRLLRRGVPMNPRGDVPRQQTLGAALSRITGVLGEGIRYGLQREEGEKLQVAFHVSVIGVDPKLIELIRSGPGRIEPDVSSLALAELGSRGVGDQGENQTVCLVALPLSDQFDSGGDVAPLIAAADLKLATLGTKQMPEVVGLYGHVAEFGVADSALHPASNAFFLEHEAEGKVLTRIAEEVHQGEGSQPVGVVPQAGCVGLGSCKIEEPGQLTADSSTL